MATTEKKGILTYVDESNNMTLLYPVTTVDAIDGLDEVISDVHDEIEKETGKVKTTADAALPKAGGAMTGDIAMGGKKITNLADPTENTHAANKGYVDGKRKVFTTTLTVNDWEGDAAPYTQRIGIEGILSTDRPHYSPVYDEDQETRLAQKEAFAMVDDLDTVDGAVILTCFEDKPEVNIPIQMEVNR